MNAEAPRVSRDACRRRSTDLLAELRHEVRHRREVRGTGAAIDVDTGIAWAALQVIDWLAWEATDRDTWPALVRHFQLNIDPHTDQRARLAALRAYAVASCPAIRLLEDFAHERRSGLPPKRPARNRLPVRRRIEKAGVEALTWLSHFTEQCCAFETDGSHPQAGMG